MRQRPPLPPAPYLVVGLARSGVAVAQALRAAAPKARIAACDRGSPPEALRAAEGLRRAGVEVHTDTDGTELLDAGSPPETVVKSPGVPAEAPVIARARERGIGVVGELEIGWRLVPNDFLAVTGTNGKTTTTELIGEVHRQAGLAVAIAGNVGTPVSAFAGTLPDEATVVCEASSFQLEDSVEFAPELAVVLNLAEDHLDRHGTMERYREAKLSILSLQSPDDVAVLNGDDPALAESKPGDLGGSAQRIWFGTGGDADVRLHANALSWRGDHLIDASEMRLAGAHNLRNAMAAAAATLARGVEPDAVRAALREFAGVPHRFEDVGEIDGVSYIDDSKATNPSAAAAALRSFEGGVHAILGGSLKGGSFEQLAPAVTASCRRCYLIGEAAPALEAALAGAGVELESCGDLEHAVSAASRSARPGETVLLAPACASFDQYRDFAERGEHFRSLVEALRGRAGGGAG